jgi:hypothetical protein
MLDGVLAQQFDELKTMVGEECQSAYRSVVCKAIAGICDVSPNELRRPIEEISANHQGNVSLWRCLSIDDFSQTRFFVVPEGVPAGLAIFEVDFLSRHEIVPPLKKESLPESWKDWGIAIEDSIHVFDREAFVKTLLTPEIFLALPEHRFATLADCVHDRLYDYPLHICRAIFDTLTDKRYGYSFLFFILDNQKEVSYRSSMTLYWVHSCLEGKKYERLDCRGLASKQCQLW